MEMAAAITDFTQYGAMRVAADKNDPGVLREVASQFEALFVQSLLKNMRDSSLAEPIFGQSDQFEMYQGMLDQQFAVEMSRGRGIGIADMLVRQLGGDVAELPVPAQTHQWAPATARSGTPAGAVAAFDSPQDFLKQSWPHAKRVAGKLGVSTQALMAQAALETGWGAHVMQRPDGSSSYNLFGIKAGQGWDGASVAKSTIEFKDGVAYRQMAKFRAYPDMAAAFDDYASFIAEQSRYSKVGDTGDSVRDFAGSLQQAGYATDPNYAAKIERVSGSTTMREAMRLLDPELQGPIKDLMTRRAHQ
jgi:flagellar protein FlgJ